MIGLLFEQAEGRTVVVIGPVDPALFEILAERLNRPEELALLHCEGAHGKFNRRALGEQQQRFKHCEGVFAT